MNNEELLNQLAKETTEAIRTVVKKMLKATVVIGKAENVNNLTCDINRGEDSPKLKSARLNALEEQSDTYYTIVPKEGSWVLAAIIENDQAEAVVISCTEIEKVIMKCGEMTFEISDAGIVLNNGGNGGIPINGKIADNLDAIKNYLSQMATAIGDGLDAVGVGSAASGPSGKLAFDTAMGLLNLDFEDMENPDVKH